MFALVVRKWTGERGEGMWLWKPGRRDVDIERDFFNLCLPSGSRGVRVVVNLVETLGVVLLL